MGTEVGKVEAVDEDIDENGMIDYLITCKLHSVDMQSMGELLLLALVLFSARCMQVITQSPVFLLFIIQWPMMAFLDPPAYIMKTKSFD
jgi:hypothetical protein